MAGVKALRHRLRCLPWQPREQTLISSGDGHTAPSLRHRQTAQARLEQEETTGWMKKRERRSYVICEVGSALTTNQSAGADSSEATVVPPEG